MTEELRQISSRLLDRPVSALWLLALSILPGGCEMETPTGTVSRSSAVAPPVLDATASSTVALVSETGAVLCSGSLVSPLVVLTAAHCIHAEGVVDVPFAVYSGRNTAVGGQYARVLTATVHPGFEPFDSISDLALLRLASPFVDSAAIPLAEKDPQIGTAVTFIGYGASTMGPLGFRHVGTAEITSMDDGRLSYEPGTCPGDSGGPVLEVTSAGDHLVGVVSFGDVICARATATSVAGNMAWIADEIRLLDPEECRGGDDRCNDACPLGDPDCLCAEDDRCALCDGADPDCSFACGPDGACADRCLAPDPDCHSSEDGAECGGDTDCLSDLCLDGFCRQRCAVDPRSGCPPWLECTEVGEELSACMPPEASGTGCSIGPRDGEDRGRVLPALGLIAAASLLGFRRRRITA